MVRTLLVLTLCLALRYLLGSTPLHFAAANGHISIIRILLAHGAIPSRADKHGVTPAMLARENGWIECADALDAAAEQKDYGNDVDYELEEVKKDTLAGLMTLWRPSSTFSTPFLAPARGNYTSSALLITRSIFSNIIIILILIRRLVTNDLNANSVPLRGNIFTTIRHINNSVPLLLRSLLPLTHRLLFRSDLSAITLSILSTVRLLRLGLRNIPTMNNAGLRYLTSLEVRHQAFYLQVRALAVRFTGVGLEALALGQNNSKFPGNLSRCPQMLPAVRTQARDHLFLLRLDDWAASCPFYTFLNAQTEVEAGMPPEMLHLSKKMAFRFRARS